jgi:hypothetical protein
MVLWAWALHQQEMWLLLVQPQPQLSAGTGNSTAGQVVGAMRVGAGVTVHGCQEGTLHQPVAAAVGPTAGSKEGEGKDHLQHHCWGSALRSVAAPAREEEVVWVVTAVLLSQRWRRRYWWVGGV